MPDGKQEMLKQLTKSPTLNQYVESSKRRFMNGGQLLILGHRNISMMHDYHMGEIAQSML